MALSYSHLDLALIMVLQQYLLILLIALSVINADMAMGQRPLASRYSFDINDPTLKSVNFTPLTVKVNSPYAEVRPMVSGNGKYLFFSRRNHHKNFAKEKDKQDIWFSALEDNDWGEPKNLGESINSKNADAPCGVSHDGKEIYFFSDLIDLKKPLMRSVQNATGWSKPVPVEIENFQTRNRFIDFFVSPKFKVIIMAIEQKDTRGDQDLYVSFQKSQDKWSTPINMGFVINSVAADFAPFLSDDGKTLYFSSNRDGGLGGCDIYRSSRLDDTWTHWSVPKNLGAGINSSKEETNFSISGDDIYFESYDLEKEVRDIFKARLPKESKISQ